MDCKDGGKECRRVIAVLFLFFDSDLDARFKRLVEDHLSHCPGCADRLAYTRKLLILVRERCARRMAPPRLRRRILDSLPHRHQEWT